MQLEWWQIVLGGSGGVLTMAGSAYAFVARSKQSHDERLQKVQDDIRTWQDEQLEESRKALAQCEEKRAADSIRCDEKVEKLRGRYDALQDKYDALAMLHSETRVLVHDLRNELARFGDAQREGGRRYYDPPSKEPVK